jgi:hypothetical protein
MSKISPEKKKEYNKKYREKLKQEKKEQQELTESTKTSEQTLSRQQSPEPEIEQHDVDKDPQPEEMLVISKEDFYNYITKIKIEAKQQAEAKPQPQPKPQEIPKPQPGEVSGESLMNTVQKTLISTVASSLGSLMIPMTFYAISTLLKGPSSLQDQPPQELQTQPQTSIPAFQIPTGSLY